MALCPIPTVVVWSLCLPVLWERIPWSDCPEIWRGNRSCYRITRIQYHSFLFKLSINITFTCRSCYLLRRNMCCLSIHKWFGWRRLRSQPCYFGPFVPLKPEEVIVSLGALKCERETNINTQLQDYSTIHFCLRLALNQHLQLVTCLGEIWVPWVSTGCLDGAVSHPDWCSLVPLSPCPLVKSSSVLLTWDVNEKQKLLLNYRTTVPCISV